MLIYKVNQWMSPKIEIRTSPLGGHGMFTLKLIKKGEDLLIFGGDYIDKDEATREKTAGKLVMQWDENLYTSEIRGEDETYFLNHSCDSNLWMKDAFTLSARRNIHVGEEVTADYALWEADEDYVSKWDCKCSSPVCRGNVTGKDWKKAEVQKRYKGHFSPLINKRINLLAST